LYDFHWVPDIANAQIFISNTHTEFNQLATNGVLEKIDLIIHPNSGFDQLSYRFVQQSKAIIVTGNEIRAEAVSNFILRSLLHATADSPYTKKWDHQRKWARRMANNLSMRLFGYGHIGKKVEQWARALSIDLEIVDPYLNFIPQKNWSEIDIVVLACTLNRSNTGMIHKDILHQLPEDAIIINPARGELIQFDDLLTILPLRPEMRAYLDVFEQEPFPHDIFPTLPNLYTSSHIAGVYDQLDYRTLEFEYTIIEKYLNLPRSEFIDFLGPMNLKKRNREDFYYE
jgi:phosphoglycerate dehydrogenase-like enzyme